MPKAARTYRVAIAGGGISGLTAALRLAQQGYKVTLYEQKPRLGGNLGSVQGSNLLDLPSKNFNILEGPSEKNNSRKKKNIKSRSRRRIGDDVYHDVFPHMYSNFYVNFWDMVENDLGMRRDQTASTDFETRDGYKVLSQGGHFKDLKPARDLRSLWSDLFVGVDRATPLDMYLYLYSVLDLLAHRFHTRGLLSDSVNGFLRSRPCVTDQVAALHDAIIMFIWSVHANATSVSSYQSFFHHAFGNLVPFLWVLRGNLQEKLIGPLADKIKETGNCDGINLNTSLCAVTLDGAGVNRIKLQDAISLGENQVSELVANTERWVDNFDYLILAVPPQTLGRLATVGERGRQITDRIPQLSHAAMHLHASPIAVMDLYFTKKLKHIPPENIMTTGSDDYFSVVDISQLWPDPIMQSVTALTLAASDYWAFPSNNPEENAYRMIRELHRYIPWFDPGEKWGESPDIDWERSHYMMNQNDRLFINQVGTWQYRPEPHYAEISNLFFAGDYCRNDIDMATVEGAVTSGLNAAVALQKVSPHGAPIKILRSPVYSSSDIRAMKLQMAPSAYAVKSWLTATEALTPAFAGDARAKPATALVSLMSLPYAYAADWLETAGSLWEDIWGANHSSQ